MTTERKPHSVDLGALEAEARKALACLRLEVPEQVRRDVQTRVFAWAAALIDALDRWQQIAADVQSEANASGMEVERLREALRVACNATADQHVVLLDDGGLLAVPTELLMDGDDVIAPAAPVGGAS